MKKKKNHRAKLLDFEQLATPRGGNTMRIENFRASWKV